MMITVYYKNNVRSISYDASIGDMYERAKEKFSLNDVFKEVYGKSVTDLFMDSAIFGAGMVKGKKK